ncbi:hypothetical protein [Paractinoplanes rishiriensis]|uniref:NUDIX hydrolase n=1 Tax=Paractinoplanes rishiriensis TaxID=1050105 RepID=A0A919MZW6_9ACTN|nr:hypothetical protein [Actinoplanes rishiriensis]GIF01785.1 hypothetical protein Ari01nite_92490 [Actinoplanes rishiriensis]
MLYVACEVVDGVASVAAIDEISEVAWCDRTTLAAYVPYPLHRPVQDYLDDKLR